MKLRSLWFLPVSALAAVACSRGLACIPASASPPECPLSGTLPEECPEGCPDASSHCVRVRECQSFRDCPSGTVCSPATGSAISGCALDAGANGLNPSCCAVSPDGGGRECVLAKPSADDTLLPVGFGVTSYPLVETPGASTPTFTWTAPQDTVYVKCALFACAPIIEGITLGAALESAAPQGSSERTIANYDACVLGGRLFEPSPNQLSLDDLTYCPSTRRIVDLTLGCWFYGETLLLGATPLVPVNPAAASPFVSEIADCDGGEGESCVLTTSGFGVCAGGSCTPRCVGDQDCDGGCDGGACMCKRGVNEFVGWCAP